MLKKGLIGFLWVIHISGLIGIALGYETFFLPKSPWTLLYVLAITLFLIPIDTKIKSILFGIFFMTGFAVEWIGVHTGWLFGNYYYGINFGPKIDGIPLLIGVNWGILSFCSHIIARKVSQNIFLKATLGASLMVFLDYFLEHICDYSGFWHFENGAGWYNYLCWWIIAFVLHLIAGKFKWKGDFTTALHIYLVQLIFAAALWIIITI